MYTLQQTINWSSTFIEYAPETAGTGMEPAISTATMVKNTILNAPFTWPWNRNEYLISSGTPPNLVGGTQDYVFTIPDFAYLEKVSLLSTDGLDGFELKDVYNRNILGISSNSKQAQPNAAAIKYYTPGSTIAVRFLPIPDQNYTGTLTYQKLSVPFTFFNFEAVDVISLVAFYQFSSSQNYPTNYFQGQNISVTGFDIAANNGIFPCVASTNSYLILTNPNAITDTHAATGFTADWSPIPDSFSDIYNNLFLAEMMASVDDAREQVYRQRGIAALLSKAEGLSEMQVNAFLAQYIARGTAQQAAALQRTQQATQARGV
jgi:hypothetical protein